MSLVSEALRKARREAAERGENLDPRTAQTTVIQVTRGPRTWQVVLVGAVVAIAAAGLGAVGVWWVLGSAPDPVVAESGDTPQVSAAVVPTPTPMVVAEPPANDVAPRPSDPTPTVAAVPATGRRLLPPTPRPAAPTPTRTPVDTALPAPAESPPPTPTGSAPAALGPNEYLGEAVIDGRRLVLDYIAYLPSGAFAEINGVEVRLGSTIEGFTVESITAAAVTLRGPDGPIVLRAR